MADSKSNHFEPAYKLDLSSPPRSSSFHHWGMECHFIGGAVLA